MAGALFWLFQLVGFLLIAAGIGVFVVLHTAGLVALIPFLTGAAFVLNLPVSAKLSYDRNFAKVGKIDGLFSERGVEFLTPARTGLLNWSNFKAYSETRHLFILRSQADVLQVVPQRAFSQEDRTRLGEILQKHLGAKTAVYNKRRNLPLVGLLAVSAIVAVLVVLVIKL